MNEIETTQAPVVDIAKIIEDLKAQGLEADKILAALQEMVADGKITEEDLAKAQEILGGEEQEKADAQKLFGVQF